MVAPVNVERENLDLVRRAVDLFGPTRTEAVAVVGVRPRPDGQGLQVVLILANDAAPTGYVSEILYTAADNLRNGERGDECLEIG